MRQIRKWNVLVSLLWSSTIFGNCACQILCIYVSNFECESPEDIRYRGNRSPLRGMQMTSFRKWKHRIMFTATKHCYSEKYMSNMMDINSTLWLLWLIEPAWRNTEMAILFMQMRTMPEVKLFGPPSTAKHMVLLACVPIFVHASSQDLVQELIIHQLWLLRWQVQSWILISRHIEKHSCWSDDY